MSVTAQALCHLIEQEFDTHSKQLPVFNRVALELQQLKNRDRVSIQQFTDLIMQDQILAGQVLKAANSAFYGGYQRITTLSGAVQRLGMIRVASLAMVAAQLLAHTAKMKQVVAYMPGLWQRSFLCATGTQWLVRQTNYAYHPEEAFLAGLFHDIGELFLLKALDVIAMRTRPPLTLTAEVIEEVLATQHTTIGAHLLGYWDLPVSYAKIAQEHHAPVYDTSNRLLVMVRIMDVVCQKLGIGQVAQPDIALPLIPEVELLGLTPAQVAQLETTIVDSMLDLPLNLD